MILVNAHTHLYSGLAPLGMPAPVRQPETFVEILETIWWRLDRALDEDSLRASARFYVADALLSGTRVLIDHHESPSFIAGSLDVLADACEELGMAAVLCYGATERNGGLEEASEGLAECRRFANANRRPRVRAAVGLHASFTVSDQTIADAAALAAELGVVLHLHVAEDLADVDDARRRGYRGVIDRLDQLGALIPGSVFAHGVHLAADEVERCRERSIWLVQNPRSNRGNRVGYPRHLGVSDRVALGTDGYPSDMSAENEALMALAADAGDDVRAAKQRLPAGERLADALFGGQLGEVIASDPAPDGVLLTADVDEIKAVATEQASRLWRRMEEM